MTPTQILLVAGILAAGVMMANFLTSKKPTGSWLLAAALCAAFTVYTGAAIAAEGPVGFIENQATSLLGVQVWYDLIISLGIAIILILPRARAAGMATAPWIIFIGLTASIGLLAMIARLLWLEQRST
jgi:uncharacterized membrane protein YgdD (TMEM256/DUF423 family)